MDKKYRIGFTAGVFDMFHRGHLALLQRCKETCSYLIVGVLTDEFTKQIKGKYPIIPEKDRAEILRAVKCVDEVVFVDEHNTHKPDAWELYHFDCCYTGDDHATPDWFEEQAVLRKKGSELIFLPYTKDVSSTMIRNAVVNRNSDLLAKKSFYYVMRKWLELKMAGKSLAAWLLAQGDKSVAVYGAGKHGELVEQDLANSDVHIAYWIDRRELKDSKKSVYSPSASLPPADAVIVTPYLQFDDIKASLAGKISSPILSLEDIINSAAEEIAAYKE